MPIISGTTCLIKSHGYFSTPDLDRQGRGKNLKPEDTEYEMKMTEGNGIILIRNPYKVLHSMRNYNAKGFYGHADASDFTGPGKLYFEIKSIAPYSYNIISLNVLLIVT